jgi:mono/diheme cytochrome c family protein
MRARHASRRAIVVRRWLAAVLVLVLAVLAGPQAFRAFMRWRESSAITRGGRLAGQLGCAGCHLPIGGKEIANPGSRWGTVPAWGQGTLMMYADDDSETAAIIKNGSPDPSSGLKPLIRMPAYGDVLSDAEVSDLVAYVRAIESDDVPDDPRARRGFDVATKNGCFDCHGPAGGGGVANPGSLTGYIPAFLGPDFADLVRSRAEFGEWVRTGRSKRVEATPFAKRFIERQRTQMPAYGRTLISDDDLAALESYVIARRKAAGQVVWP